MSTGSKVWILTGQSESGDPYLWVFAKKPTDKDERAAVSSDRIGEDDGWSEEEKDGPGSYGSRVLLDLPEKVEVINN